MNRKYIDKCWVIVFLISFVLDILDFFFMYLVLYDKDCEYIMCKIGNLDKIFVYVIYDGRCSWWKLYWYDLV